MPGEELVRAERPVPSAGDPARVAYGAYVDRLAGVKAEFDPENLFRRHRRAEPAE